VPPGASRHRISVATTWQSCPSECKEPPPLPAGTYKTQVFIVSSQPVFSSAAPLTVHLRAAR
jgi:hypothetical protein